MRPPEPPSPALARAQALLDARIDWERRDRGGMRVDVAPSLDLCSRLGDPQRALRTVHVGGTKGKGSVASLIAAGLQAAGWRVGLYSSPHVERITERVRLQGREVEDDLLASGIDAALAAREAAEREGTPAAGASWFDLFTAGAFHALRAGGAEWAVIEVGLGGRLDSTNVLEAALAVLTSIDLEHTAVLGSTREAIAAEKAGILRSGLPLVCGVPAHGGEDDPGRVIAERAQELGCPMRLVPRAATIAATNLALARTALEALGRCGHAAPDGAALAGELLTDGVAAAAQLPGR
ncbi:MAG: bifunctional folylpolyglutamate synthase/dihydrofolate synthase, partial [Planctomycetota bacterium]|nr:bifunctional folylpolyglutamate synthase/dihydrofolate synthase [Planctomycetota bacterium]